MEGGTAIAAEIKEDPSRVTCAWHCGASVA